MRRKRIIALMLVVSMLTGMNKSVMGAAAPTQKSAEKTEKMQEYLVTAEDGSKYEILKQEMNQTGKRVIHHKKSDEKYLEDSQSIVVKLTPSEADRYTGENGIKIEKEKTHNGKIYRCTAAQAYEDNPYFASYRFSFAQNYSQSYIDRMKSDTGATSDKLTSYCSNAANRLYVGNYSEWKE